MGSYNYYNPSSSNSAYIGKFAIIESNDINANSSTINWTFSLYRNDSYHSNYSREEGNRVVVSIDGREVFNETRVGTVKPPNGEDNAYVLASGSTVVGHNSDGTKSFSFSARYTNSYSSSISPLEVSGNHICNAIPRGSTFNIGSSSLYIGQTQSYSISRYSSSYQHRISMTVKNAKNEDVTVFLQDGVDTTLAATVPWKIVEYMYLKNLSSVTVTTHMLTYYGTVNNVIGGMSKTFTAKIPAASMSLSSSSINMGSTTNINISRNSRFLNYRINFSFGSFSSQIASLGVDGNSSYTFQPNIDTYSPQIPSSKSGTGTVTVLTYSGSTLVGSSSANLTLSLPSNLNYTPEFSGDLSTGNTYSGFCLKNRSMISGSFSGIKRKYGANIKTQKITINGTNYGNSFSNVLLTSAGTYTIVYYLEDTRGYSKTLSKTVTVYNYELPKITNLQISRDQTDHTKGIISFNATYFKPSKNNFSNTATVKLSYGSTVLTLATYEGNAETAGLANIAFTNEEIKNGAAAAIFSTEKAYTFFRDNSDSVNGSTAADTKSTSIQSLFYLVDFKEDKGVAFGKGSIGNGFEVDFDGYFYKKLDVSGSLTARSGLELYSTTPFINFHHGNSSSDYTARIIADGSNTLNLTASGGVKENGTLLSSKYAAASHSHSYLPTSGGSISGSLSVNGGLSVSSNLSASGTISEGGKSLSSKYAAASHSHSYLPLSGGNLNGDLILPFNRTIYWNSTGKGARIFSNDNQRLYFGASTEQQYYLYYGVSRADMLWEFGPDIDCMLNLGTPTYRWGQIYSQSSTVSTSDRNLKKDVFRLNPEKMTKFIMALEPVSYKFIDGDSGRTHTGMVAQQLEEEALPAAEMDDMDFAGFIKSPKVEKYTDENGKRQERIVEGEYIYGLRYEEFIAPIIAVVQKQEKEIAMLKEEIEKLKEAKK